MEQPNKISQPDFAAAEQKIHDQHTKNVERRLAQTTLKAFFSSDQTPPNFTPESPQPEAPSDQLSEPTRPEAPSDQLSEPTRPEALTDRQTPESPVSLSDFFDPTDPIFSTPESPTPESPELSPREQKAETAMRELIKTNLADSAKTYFQLKKSISDTSLMLKIAQSTAQAKNLPTRSKITDSIRAELYQLEQAQSALPE